MYPNVAFRRVAVVACLVALKGTGFAQQATQYTATLVSGPGSTASSIGAFGNIIGSAIYSGGATHATAWANGQTSDLGTLGGTNSTALGQTTNIGTVVGWSETSGGNRHAFLADLATGGLADLGTLGGSTSTATGIGGAGFDVGGIVVGFSTTANGAIHAFSSDTLTMTDLGTLGGPSSAADAIGSDEVIVGASDIAGCAAVPCTRHAVTWTAGAIKDLGVLSDSVSTDSSEALGVSYTSATNDIFFGYAQVQGVSHPVLWGWDGSSAATDLGALDAGGGVILGFQSGFFGQSTKLDGSQHATWWIKNADNQTFTATDLNTLLASTSPLQPVLTKAYGQNNDGWILATSADSVYVLAPLTFNQSSLAFGTALVGAQSGAQPLKITYTLVGGTTSQLITVTTTGDFKFDSVCSSAFVNPGDNCSGYVVMIPSKAGPITGTLVVTPQSPQGFPLSLPLSGVGGISATLSASSATVAKGTPFTLSWSTVGGTGCSATGGGSGDGWSGLLAPTGSMSISETTSGMYAYTLTCTAANQTASAQAVVTITDSASSGGSSGGGGGGVIGAAELVALLIGLVARLARRRTWRRLPLPPDA